MMARRLVLPRRCVVLGGSFASHCFCGSTDALRSQTTAGEKRGEAASGEGQTALPSGYNISQTALISVSRLGTLICADNLSRGDEVASLDPEEHLARGESMGERLIAFLKQPD